MEIKLVFGDPASIAERDRGREEWIRTQIECPGCGAKGNKPQPKRVECDECGKEHTCSQRGEIRQISTDDEKIYWECGFCWEKFHTNLDGEAIENLEVVD